jgi:hypothetical protein
MTFLLGKDLSYFQRVIRLVDSYNRQDERARQNNIQREKKKRKTKEEKLTEKLDGIIYEENRLGRDVQIARITLEARQKQELLELEREFKIKEIKLRKQRENIKMEVLR